jgi:type I restriction enzyme S subunit
VVRFGEVATFTKKPGDLRYSEYHEVPFVPMDLIPIDKLFSEEFTLKINDELSSGTYFEPGDILLAKITPSFENGKQCIIEELPTPFGIATTEIIPIREVPGVSDKSYLFYYLLRSDVRALLAGRMQGTTGRQRLNKETLVNLEIPLPPLPEQCAIAQVFQAIDEKTATLQQETALLDELFHAMLDELMTGNRSAVPLIDREE